LTRLAAGRGEERDYENLEGFGPLFLQGVAIEQVEPEELYLPWRFRTNTLPNEWSRRMITSGMKEGQKEIYYILGDDERSVIYSPT
jgi:HSP90 family molecular chaperone